MNAKVSSAISSLEQEVLKTLIGGPLQPQDIASILDTEVFTERPDGRSTGKQNPIIIGVLWGLERRKLVKQPNPRDPWEITPEGKKYVQLKGGTNMAVDIKKIIKQIDGMDTQELSELVKALYCHRKLGPLSKTRLCYNDNLLERSLRLSYKCIITNALTLC